MQCKGFLFDLDGTLVDSLPVVERSWCKWGDRFAIDHDEILSFIHGKQAITSIRHFMPGRSEEDIQAEFRYLEQMEATDIEGIVALPGALALLNTLNEAGIPWALSPPARFRLPMRVTARRACRCRRCLSPLSR